MCYDTRMAWNCFGADWKLGNFGNNRNNRNPGKSTRTKLLNHFSLKVKEDTSKSEPNKI